MQAQSSLSWTRKPRQRESEGLLRLMSAARMMQLKQPLDSRCHIMGFLREKQLLTHTHTHTHAHSSTCRQSRGVLTASHEKERLLFPPCYLSHPSVLSCVAVANGPSASLSSSREKQGRKRRKGPPASFDVSRLLPRFSCPSLPRNSSDPSPTPFLPLSLFLAFFRVVRP